MNKAAAMVMEVLWLILGTLSLGAGIYELAAHGAGQAWVFFLMAVIALFMYLYRRSLRLKKRQQNR